MFEFKYYICVRLEEANTNEKLNKKKNNETESLF